MIRSNNNYLNYFLSKATAVRIKDWKVGITGVLQDSKNTLIEKHLIVDICNVTAKEIEELREKQLTRLLIFWEDEETCRFYKSVLLDVYTTKFGDFYTIEFRVRQV